MSEKQITDKILRYLKTLPGCFAWKEHGGMYGTAGLPDIICCIGGRFVAFEVKAPAGDGRPAGKLTKLQEAAIRRINNAKGCASMVSTLEEVQIIIQTLGGLADDDSVDLS